MRLTEKQTKIFWTLKVFEVVGAGLWYWLCTIVGRLVPTIPKFDGTPDVIFDIFIAYFVIPFFMTFGAIVLFFMLRGAIAIWIEANERWAVQLDAKYNKPVKVVHNYENRTNYMQRKVNTRTRD
jgi:hypothetical protein